MKKKALLLILINLGLMAAVAFTLNALGIMQIKNPFAKEAPVEQTTNDPFLLEKDSLKKQWAVLSAKENYFEQEKTKFKNDQTLLQDKMKELNKQIETNKGLANKIKQVASNQASQDQNLRNLASKITNVAPTDGAAMLSDMEPSVAVDVIRMMDTIAAEQGAASTSAYLISLMKPESRKKVVGLMAEYPNDINALDE